MPRRLTIRLVIAITAAVNTIAASLAIYDDTDRECCLTTLRSLAHSGGLQRGTLQYETIKLRDSNG